MHIADHAEDCILGNPTSVPDVAVHKALHAADS